MSEPFRRVSVFLLYALMLAPSISLFRVWPLNSAMVDGLSMVLVGLLVAVVFFARKSLFLRFNQASLYFVGFIAALVVSVWLNEYSYEASWRWYLISLFFCVVVTLAACEWKAIAVQSFHSALAASLWMGCFAYGVMSLLKYYGVLEGLFPWVAPSGARLSGIWFQPNLTTTICWLGILAASVSLSGNERKGWFIVSVIVFGWVVACAASRMSWVMAVGLFALLLVSQLPRFSDEDSRIAKKWLFWGVITVVIMMFAVPLVNIPLREFLAQAGLLHSGSVVSLADRDVAQDTARLLELRKLLASLGQFSSLELVFGVGPGNYPAFSFSASPGLSPDGFVSATWLHSHNLFTMIFVEFGLIGLLLLIGLVGKIIWVALTSPYGRQHFFSVGALGLLFIHSNLEFPLWYPWFLIVCCLLLVDLFKVREIKGDSKALKPVVGGSFAAMVVALVLNVGYQYLLIVDVASEPDPGAEEFQSLALLANDSLMGPYAILRKYRDFPPERANLNWQLREVRRMEAWQPRDLVLLREYSLLVLKGDVEEACAAAEATAYRHPYSAPIMLEHAVKAGTLQPEGILRLAGCIEKGLAPRGQTIPSVEAINQKRLTNR